MRDTPREVMFVIAFCSDRRARSRLSSRGKLDSEILRFFATSDDDGIVGGAVGHKNTPIEAIPGLLDYPWAKIREHARKRLEDAGIDLNG